MKIGIITFHSVHNYGAMLQCYALQKYISEIGADVQVIDYEPKYQKSFRKWYLPAFNLAKKQFKKKNMEANTLEATICGIEMFIKASIRNILDHRLKNRSRCFECFKNSNMVLTNMAENLDDLRKISKNFDCIICGSDQIWNPNCTNGIIDKAYYGEFAVKGCPIYSYAVSACELINCADYNEITNAITNISVLSMREETIAQELRTLTGRNIRVDVDPCFLIDREKYKSVECECPINEEYVLLYTLDDPPSRELIINQLQKYIRNKGIIIIDISKRPVREIDGCRVFYEVGPDMFLTLIKNAACIFTNSFHGTAFSIIYNRPFYVGIPSIRGERIESLLSNVDLRNRTLNVDYDFEGESINYDHVNYMVQQMREKSFRYLKDIVNNAL